jgi:hypothetical protein
VNGYPGEAAIKTILRQYSASFTEKTYNEENEDHDVIMDVFGVTPLLKRENRQYWGRELGMCWQLLVCALFRETVSDYGPGYRVGQDELCDLVAGKDAIDTKYRIGSGDSGTLKKFKQYGKTLRDQGYKPILLIVREDNLGAAIQACNVGGWQVLTGQSTFDYIQRKTGADLLEWLKCIGIEYRVDRSQIAQVCCKKPGNA